MHAELKRAKISKLLSIFSRLTSNNIICRNSSAWLAHACLFPVHLPSAAHPIPTSPSKALPFLPAPPYLLTLSFSSHQKAPRHTPILTPDVLSTASVEATSYKQSALHLYVADMQLNDCGNPGIGSKSCPFSISLVELCRLFSLERRHIIYYIVVTVLRHCKALAITLKTMNRSGNSCS